MKKLFALLIAMMMVLSLAACGGGNDTPDPSGGDNTPGSSQQQEQPGDDNNGGKTDDENTKPNDVFKEITTENCLQLIKDTIGITITLPEGWTVSEASSLVGAHIYIDCGDGVSYDDVNAFFESVFASLKETIGADGVGHFDKIAYGSFTEGKAAGEDSFRFAKSDGTSVYVEMADEDWDYSTGEEMVTSVKIYLSF